MKQTRAYCDHCKYPKKTCLCAAVSTFETGVQIDILQHPSEVTAAKNTARLCKLCIPNIQIWVGEQQADFFALRRSIVETSSSVFVLYPHETAIAVDELPKRMFAAQQIRIVLLDGTWKKAYKIWQLNPWLHDYPSIRLTDRVSQYEIRKAPSTTALSTIEALAYCLETFEPSAPIQHLFKVFHAMQKPFLHFSPVEK